MAHSRRSRHERQTIPIRPASQTEEPQFEAFVAAIAGVSERQIYSPRNLQIFAYASGHTLWSYRHGDEFRECLALGFFYGAPMEHGDMVTIKASELRRDKLPSLRDAALWLASVVP